MSMKSLAELQSNLLLAYEAFLGSFLPFIPPFPNRFFRGLLVFGFLGFFSLLVSNHLGTRSSLIFLPKEIFCEGTIVMCHDDVPGHSLRQ